MKAIHEQRSGEFLEREVEALIDPDLPICDSHHHLWDGPGDRGRYLFDEYALDALAGHNVVKTIFVECGAMYRKDGPEAMRPVGETEFVRSIVVQNVHGQPRAAGVAAAIVGYSDLTVGEMVAEVLEAHLDAGRNHFRGVRQSCTWDDDPVVISMGKSSDMMSDSRFREGFSRLNDYGLTFDAWQYYTQLPQLAELARVFPETTIIVNHTGGPLGIGRHAGRRDEVFQEWRRGMSELALCPNVVVKLGGLGMPRCGFSWHEQPDPPRARKLVETMAPYYRFCIDIFGTERCMFESNFPVDKVSYSYTVLWNAFKLICKDCSAKEKADLFHDTAVRVYRLDRSSEA